MTRPGHEKSPHNNRWWRVIAPWATSGVVHIVLASIVIVSIYAGGKVVTHFTESQKSVFIPTTFDDPGASADGTVTGVAGDPTAHAINNRLKELLPQNTEPLQAGSGKSLTAALTAGDAEAKPYAIGFGSGGNLPGSGGQSEGGSPFGVPGGTGRGPRATFYGTTGNAMKIVYVLDRTGTMVDQWRTGVQAEVKKSVHKLVPAQTFAVITFTSDEFGGAQIVGNWTGMRFANREVIQAFDFAFSDIPCAGGGGDEYNIFVNAFKLAFSLKPQQIFFLTDGDFRPELLDVVDKLNRDRSVKISTIAFTVSKKSETPTAQAIRMRMKQLAERNGGAFKEIGGE